MYFLIGVALVVIVVIITGLHLMNVIPTLSDGQKGAMTLAFLFGIGLMFYKESASRTMTKHTYSGSEMSSLGSRS